MKISLSGENRRFNMFELGDDELFEYVDNHPYPELMGGKLADAIKRGTKKIKAKVQKVVKKAKAKYKTLPKWAKVATGILAAPAAIGLAPAALGLAPAVIGAAAPLASIAATTALSAAPAALPILQAKKMAQMIEKKRKARLAAQAQIAQPSPAAVQEQAQEIYQAPVQQQYNQQVYDQQAYDDYQDQDVTTSNAPEEKKGIPGWLLGAAALIPFFL
jgi:hypothetical protein